MRTLTCARPGREEDPRLLAGYLEINGGSASVETGEPPEVRLTA